MMDAQQTTVREASLFDLPKVDNVAGRITAINSGIDIDFDIERVYYLYDVPGGVDRGAHGHRALHQVVVAAGGSFTITLFDGASSREFFLNRPYQGLYIPPGMWRTLNNFSSGAICLVLASHRYDEGDYIRDYNEFLQFKKL